MAAPITARVRPSTGMFLSVSPYLRVERTSMFMAVRLDVEAEVDHIAVAHHILLPLQACDAALTRRGKRAGLDQVVIGGHLGTNEAALNVAVDGPGRLWGARAA